MRYQSFPIQCGRTQDSLINQIVADQLADNLSRCYTDDPESFSYAELYAFASMVEWSYRHIEKCELSSFPSKSSGSALDRWEDQLGLVSYSGLTDSERRKRLAAKFLYLSNTNEYLESMVKYLVGPAAFDDIYVTFSQADVIWRANPDHPGNYAIPWSSNASYVRIQLKYDSLHSEAEFEKLRAILSEILDSILPVYCSFDVLLSVM